MSLSISIILPIFNGEQWIEKTIFNLLNQTFKDFEILIVNDGSTDLTDNIILRYAKLDHRIRYFKRKHYGLTNTLNYALKKSIGKWIARIDVDDSCELNRLENQFKFVEYRKNIVLLGSNFKIKKNGNLLYQSNLPTSHNKLLYRLVNMKAFFPHSSAFFLREKALEVGGYREAFIKSQDHDLWLRLSEKGEIACTKEKLIVVNDHNKRISNSKKGYPQHVYNFIAICSYHLRKQNIPYLDNYIDNKSMEKILEKGNKFLKDNYFYENQKLKKRLKIVLYEKGNLIRLKKITSLIFENFYLFFLLLKKILIGTNLPYKFSLTLKNRTK